jgi:hypothetical protein
MRTHPRERFLDSPGNVSRNVCNPLTPGIPIRPYRAEREGSRMASIYESVNAGTAPVDPRIDIPRVGP